MRDFFKNMFFGKDTESNTENVTDFVARLEQLAKKYHITEKNKEKEYVPEKPNWVKWYLVKKLPKEYIDKIVPNGIYLKSNSLFLSDTGELLVQLSYYDYAYQKPYYRINNDEQKRYLENILKNLLDAAIEYDEILERQFFERAKKERDSLSKRLDKVIKDN